MNYLKAHSNGQLDGVVTIQNLVTITNDRVFALKCRVCLYGLLRQGAKVMYLHSSALSNSREKKQGVIDVTHREKHRVHISIITRVTSLPV